MNFFDDKKIKKIAKSENIKAPDNFLNSIDETLENLTEKNQNNKNVVLGYRLKLATAFILLAFILLPNISPQISYAMQKIPVIGNLIKVITIRNYFDKEGNSELNANIPNIQNSDYSKSQSNENINEEVNKLTQRVIENYYAEKNPENHLLVEITSEVITNNDKWFTLKLTISQTSGSSNLEYKYYHIDKKTDKIVNLSDLFINADYKEVISSEIKKQMISRMKENPNLVYWFDEESQEWSFRKVNGNQNFYFSKNGNIVIVFDKYEVGPGSSGAPEFEIDKEIYKKYLKTYETNYMKSIKK